jgi:gluconokinase
MSDARQVILALDIGTSSTRAVAYAADTGEPVPDATFVREHQPAVTADGGSTLPPDTIVEEAVDCLERVLRQLGPKMTPLGVGISCFWHSFVGVDGDGAPQTPILLWSDRRSTPQVEQLRGRIDVNAYTQRTGCQLHTSYALGRLLWLSQTAPDVWARCRRVLSPSEYLLTRLFGPEHVTASVSMASATGLFDQKARAWDTQTLANVPGLGADGLPPIGDAPVHGLLGEYRDRLPALAQQPWFPALGDGACSNIGSGVTRPGTVALMIGTSGALRAVVAGPAPPAVAPGLWRYQIDADRYLVGGALSNGGAVWAWLRQTLKLDGPEPGIEAQIGQLRPDDHGLTVLPFLYGERAPLWRDDLTAAIVGLRADSTPIQIARAHLEAVAYRFAAVRDAMRATVPAGRLVGTGAGLLASPVWAQILADVLNEELETSTEPQASARGAALWAREQLGLGTIEDAPRPAIRARLTPRPENVPVYAVGRKRHEALLSNWLEWSGASPKS